MAEPTFIARSYGGKAAPTDLSVAISGAGDTSFTVIAAGTWLESHGANAGSALGTTGPFTVVVDSGLATEEHILCSAVNTSSGVVTVYNSGGFLGRGYDGTTAQAHATSAGTGYVYPFFGSVDGYEANVAAQFVNVGTTAGDTLYFSAARVAARRAIGANGTVYTSNGSAPTWALPLLPLTPTAKSGDYTAVSGDLISMTGTHTVTLPTATTASIVGVLSVSGVCTISTGATILGPGVAVSATSIKLGSAGAFVILEADGTNWHIIAGQQDSGWVDTTSILGTGWVNGGSTDSYYRLQGNTMRLVGPVVRSSGSGATIMTLPAGYRPPTNQPVSGAPAIHNQSGTYLLSLIDVTSAGLVEYHGTAFSFGDLLYLDSITFTVD